MTTKVTEEGSSTDGSANASPLRELAPKAQSEAPSKPSSVDELDKIILEFERVFLIRAVNSKHPNIDFEVTAETVGEIEDEAKAKINRLITEAEIRGFDMAFDSHDYDRLREYRLELSNKLSKEDTDG